MYNQAPKRAFLIKSDRSSDEQGPVRVPVTVPSGGWFVPVDWWRDGTLLLGVINGADSNPRGFGIYSLANGSFERVSEFGNAPRWLSDGLRILFWHEGRVYLVDRRTRAPVEVLAPSEVQETLALNFDILSDNRRIYFSLMASEADVWLMESSWQQAARPSHAAVSKTKTGEGGMSERK